MARLAYGCMRAATVVPFAAGFLLSSCGALPSSHTSSAASADAYVASGPVTPLSQSDLLTAVRKLAVVANQANPASSFSLGANQGVVCPSEKASTDRVDVNGDAFAATYDADISPCVQTLAGSSGVVTVSNPSGSLAMTYADQCPGVDISAMNGQPFSSYAGGGGVTPSGACQFKDGYVRHFGDSLTFAVAATLTDAQDTSKSGGLTAGGTTTLQAAGGGLCQMTYQGGSAGLDGCDYRDESGNSVTPTGASAITAHDLKVVSMHGLQGKISDQYYHAGTMDLTVNDWTSTVTFTSGTQAPVAAFTSGAQSVQIRLEGALSQIVSGSGAIPTPTPVAPPAGAPLPPLTFPVGTQLHVVGIFGTGATGATVSNLPVTVDLKEPGVLVLASEEAVHWQLNLTPGSVVMRVLVSGGQGQSTVSGIAATAVDQRPLGQGSDEASSAAYIAAAEAATGLKMQSFVGGYQRTEVIVNDAAVQALPAGTKLMAVSTYGSTSGSAAPAVVEVTVNTPGPVVLAFSAMQAVTWHVTASASTQVVRVIVGGYADALATGVPTAVIQETSLDYVPTGSGPAYDTLASQLLKMTGLPISNFQTQYAATAVTIP